MIPIVSISDLINGVISALIAGRIYHAYRQKPDNMALRDFFLFFLFVTMFWIAAAAPQIIVQEPYHMMIINIAAYVLLFVALAIINQIPFRFITHSKYIGEFVAILIIIGTIVFVAGRVANPSPHAKDVIPPFIYWRPVMAPWLRLLAGVMTAGSAMISSVMFFALGYKNKGNKIIFRRSIYMGTGMTIYLVGAVIAFLVDPSAGFFANSIATLSIIPGMLIMLYGIFYGEHGQTNASA